MSEQATELRCDRCSVPLKVSEDRNPDARLLRHSLTTGVCAGCAMTAFLKGTEPLASILAQRGPGILTQPAVQAQAEVLLSVGNADADRSELDWQAIVANWELS